MNLRELLQRATGLQVSQAAVERALRQRMQERAIRDQQAYLDALAPDELEALIELVVVPESWMFRDPEAFGLATDFVRERLAAGAGMLQILSIPCAGGEEPYSMAMALHEAHIARHQYSIDAIDLSSICIARAQRAMYGRNAFRGQNTLFRERYFSEHGEQYQLIETIRQQVNFSQGNLLRMDIAANAGRYDIIFCRNLLIYFDEPTAAAAIGNLHALLSDEGILFAGYAEVPAFCRYRFTPLRQRAAFALRKDLGQQRNALRVPAPTPAVAAPRPARPKPTVAPHRPERRAVARPAPGAAPAVAPAPSREQALQTARKQADQGQFADASKSCLALLAHEPECAEAYFILGMVNEAQQKSQAAADYWKRCIYLEPGHYEALCHLALLAGQDGDATQAAAYKQRAARIYQRADKAKA